MGLDRAQVQSPSGLNKGEFLHDITSYSIFTSKYHVIASIGGVLHGCTKVFSGKGDSSP